MARHTDYYHDENRKVRRDRPKGSGRRLLLWIADVVMLVVSVVAALVLFAGLLAKIVNPHSVALFAFAGLFYQVTFVVNLACALWWVVRWKRWFFLSAVMLLIGGGSMGLFYRNDASAKQNEVVRAREDVVVASYNVMNFNSPDSEEGVSSYHSIIEWLNGQGVQIACIQEAHFSASKSFADFKEGLKKMGYGFFAHNSAEKSEEVKGSGYAIFSTYPIVRHGVVCKNEKDNVKGVWADVKIERDTIRVYNLHLQSTGITGEDQRSTLSPQIIEDTMARAKLSKVVAKMVDNYRARAEQAQEIASHIEASPYPMVVCGDFNDPPMSYAYGTIASADDLMDSFVEQGRGTEYTFKGLYNLFRIDYVLADEEKFEVKSYDSYDLEYSDHKPVVVRLGRKIE